MKKERKEFMSSANQKALKGLPRSHANCMEKTGVMRPGKTAKDRARGGG